MPVRAEDRNQWPGRPFSIISCAPEMFFVAFSPVSIDSSQKTGFNKTPCC